MSSPVKSVLGRGASLSSDDLFDNSSSDEEFGGQSSDDSDCLESVQSEANSDGSRDLFDGSDSDDSNCRKEKHMSRQSGRYILSSTRRHIDIHLAKTMVASECAVLFFLGLFLFLF